MDQLWQLAVFLVLLIGFPAVFLWLMRGLASHPGDK